MPKQLQNVALEEVSLVDEPACPDANILIAKNKKGNRMGLGDLLKKFGFKKAMTLVEATQAQEIQESVWALNTSLNSILSDEVLDDAGKAAKIQESITQFLAIVKNPQGDDMTKTEMSIEDKAKAYDEMKAKEAEAAKACDPATTTEDLKKARANAETLAAENAELKKKLAEQGEKQEGETRLAKAKELTANLPSVKAEDLANVLKGMSAEQTAALEGIVKTLGEQVKAGGLFKSVGVIGGDSDAEAQLEAKAQEIAKAESVSIVKARSLAYERNPDLYGKVRGAA